MFTVNLQHVLIQQVCFQNTTLVPLFGFEGNGDVVSVDDRIGVDVAPEADEKIFASQQLNFLGTLEDRRIKEMEEHRLPDGDAGGTAADNAG